MALDPDTALGPSSVTAKIGEGSGEASRFTRRPAQTLAQLQLIPIVLLVAAVTLAACRSPQQPPATSSSESAYRPTSTLTELMVHVIEPPANALRNSVSVVIDERGTLENAPQTDEEWAVVRAYAVQLAEASNLLLMPGRAVARPGERPRFPGVDREFVEIAGLIDSDRAAWDRLAHGLHDGSMAALTAIDARDAEGLRDAGDVLDETCEACHVAFWYATPSAP